VPGPACRTPAAAGAGGTGPAPDRIASSGPVRGRRGAWRLLGLALLLCISCRDATTATASGPAGAEPPPEAAAAAERVRVFLIAPQDGARSGRKVACGDSAVPVEVTLPRPAPALEGALRALLAMGDRYDRASGLLNPLYASRLELAGMERQGAQVKVRLTGYVELGDACDNSRMFAQLTETALQFRGISSAQFEIDGQPLRELLLARTSRGPSSRGDANGPGSKAREGRPTEAY
jgi:Sporulation and spore germination